MPPVIKVESLSKRYRLGQIGGGTLYGDLNRWWARVRGAPDPTLKIGQQDHGQRDGEYIWALKDVSFEVQQGEVLGIIGKNGAGKSTLLKILSRITAPTSGEVRLKGRVGSLLEVGTGFHPELTGRENIYLNGAILGMSTGEVARKFDEIVDFSGVEQFIDTPVKRYSSGMYVRLAFAVAAHLDPEILVVDEVLAVGDAEFQKKCLGKMDEVAREEGRTVLFVSHNMVAIEGLCSVVCVLDAGCVEFLGDTRSGIATYSRKSSDSLQSDIDLSDHYSRRKGSVKILTRIRILDERYRPKTSFLAGDTLILELTVNPEDRINVSHIGIGVDDWFGLRIFSVTTSLSGYNINIQNQNTLVKCKIKNLPLTKGRYSLSLSAGSYLNPLMDALDNAVQFDVNESDYFGSGKFPSGNLGRILIKPTWETIIKNDTKNQ